MDPAAADQAIGAIRDWLITEGRFIDGTGSFDEAFVLELRARGLPIDRFTTGVPSLHPNVDSFSTLWEPESGISFRTYRQEDDPSGSFRHSPIYLAYDEARITHIDLTAPPVSGEYSFVDDLRQQGFQEYLVFPVPFSDRTNKAVTYCTRRVGGFTGNEVRALGDICDTLATVLEARYLRHMAGTLMDTYVGPIAGRRVLDGQIKRGAGETIRAAIWFCDLKGFTSLSELLPRQQLIDMLNAYFDTVTPAIEEAGGEILKFIGDAVLAIFQPSDGDEAAATAKALKAARAATQALLDTNADRREADQPEIGCGIALHFGDVHYGNVGGENRLDFTVIGPAVNLASRIEGLTRDLKRPVLVSSEFAALSGDSFDSMGEFSLKGIGEKRAVYAPQ